MNKTIEHRSYKNKLEFRAEDGKPPVVEGYAAVFNSPTDFGQANARMREVVLPGAFKESLAAGADVRLLINHEGLPLARTKSGTLQLREDSHGLHVHAELDPTDPDVQALMPKMRRGDLDQMSFGFFTRADNWRMDGGVPLRELRAVDVFDVSIVTMPAYDDTNVALRSREAFLSDSSQESDRLKLLIDIEKSR